MTRIATVSFSVENDKECNLAKMDEFIAQAANQDVDLLLFPELCVTGYGYNPTFHIDPKDVLYYNQVAELVPEGPSTQRLIEKAKEHDMYIAWSMTEKDPEMKDVVYNCAVLVGPEGFVGKYRKVHLVLTERLIHWPGRDIPVFDTKLGRIGMQICYDKFFPEVARTLALKGARIILSPTAWPAVSGKEDDPDLVAYLITARSRAIENSVVWVEANCCNEYEAGHSEIITPKAGEIVATTGFDEGMAVADVDVDAEILDAKARGAGDMMKDRRPDVYGTVLEPNGYCPYSYGIPPRE